MHFLFYKARFAWPRASGHDVHTYNMMRALSRLGATISLVTAETSPPEALAGVPFTYVTSLDRHPPASRPGPPPLTGFEERYRAYWGVPNPLVTEIGRLANELAADVVVAAGLNVLPALGAVERAVRVWYAADEWAWHHLSQVTPGGWGAWEHVREAAVKGLYERAFRRRIDRAWVVSPADRRAMRWVAGVAQVDVVPNGVDTELYRPRETGESPETAVFWGRLDFGPNVQALEWFCRTIWPDIVRARPGARFAIVGFQPTARVEALTRLTGIELHANVPDIRPDVAARAVVVMPFVSGGGVKNKLLEAAAMGKAIVCTPRALNGLRGDPPLRVAGSRAEWVAAVLDLWDHAGRRRAQGALARAWVERDHTWESGARTVLAALTASRPAARDRLGDVPATPAR